MVTNRVAATEPQQCPRTKSAPRRVRSLANVNQGSPDLFHHMLDDADLPSQHHQPTLVASDHVAHVDHKYDDLATFKISLTSAFKS